MTATCDPSKFTGNALSRANTIYLHKSLHNLHFCLISAYANRLLDYKLKRWTFSVFFHSIHCQEYHAGVQDTYYLGIWRHTVFIRDSISAAVHWIRYDTTTMLMIVGRQAYAGYWLAFPEKYNWHANNYKLISASVVAGIVWDVSLPCSTPHFSYLHYSFHLVFYLPLHLCPGTVASAIIIKTRPSTLLLTCFYHFSLFFVTSSVIHPRIFSVLILYFSWLHTSTSTSTSSGWLNASGWLNSSHWESHYIYM